MERDEISRLASAFVTGADVSIQMANRLEVLLDTAFPGDDQVQETVVMLALYRPGGGEWLLGTEVLQEQLLKTLKHLRLG